jgi:hypothetical protein
MGDHKASPPRQQRRHRRLDELLARQQFMHWQKDTDFNGVRNAPGIMKLSPSERDAWRKLWADEEDQLALLRRCPDKLVEVELCNHNRLRRDSPPYRAPKGRRYELNTRASTNALTAALEIEEELD